MQFRHSLVVLFAFITAARPAISQSDEGSRTVPLVVEAGTPLRLYITTRLSQRAGEAVKARLLEPLYAFDREVAPAGSEVFGKVVRLKPTTGMARAAAILGGDFTPLHQAQVQFTTLLLPGGRRVSLHTVATQALNSIADLNPNKKKAAASNQHTGVLGTAKAQVKDRVNGAKQTISDMVRAPDRKERLEDFLLAKLPYHPQHLRRGTRFDAELADPVQFGTAVVPLQSMRMLGSQPAADASVEARLVTALDSDSSTQGERVEAVITRPLFSGDKQLLLPEGTRLVGAVTMVHRARWFHRGGQLRFNFQNIELPDALKSTGQAEHSTRTLAMLQATEQDAKKPVKVDEEGTVKSSDSRTRFIAPAVAYVIASRAADQDVNKRTGVPESNTGGRSLGGASGLGLLGVAAAKASANVASALGYYGLAWSVYSNVIARGREVEFNRNASINIRFGERAAAGKNLRPVAHR